MITENHNITTGNLNKGLIVLAAPMFVSAMLQNVQSLIDLFWVSRLGTNSVAALALSGTVLMLLFPAIMGMSAGTVSLVSRAIGSGNNDEAADVGGQSLSLAVIVGIITGLSGYLLSEYLCKLLGANDAVSNIGAEYLRITFVGCFTIFVLFIGNSILQASGNTFVPMCAMVLANLLNLILDPLFIFGFAFIPEMGVRGAALATVVSQIIAAGLVLAVLSSGMCKIHIKVRQLSINMGIAWRIIRIGIPSSGQMLSRSLMNLVLMRIVALYGTAVIAAYGIGLRLQMLILMPAFALGAAAATMVGQNLGAGKPERARAAAWLAVGYDMIIMVLAVIVLIAFAPSIIGVFDKNPEVIRIGTGFIRIVSISYLFVALAIVFGRSMQGAGDTVPPMVTTVICLWGVQVPLAFILSRQFGLEYNGVWWAMAVAITAHGIMNALWFETGRWKTKKV